MRGNEYGVGGVQIVHPFLIAGEAVVEPTE